MSTLTRRGLVRRYSGETTEENFHRLLDANPEDHHTRLVFADWLQDHGDPRAEGYRALGMARKHPGDNAEFVGGSLVPYFSGTHTWSSHPRETVTNARLPRDWWNAITAHVTPHTPSYYKNHVSREQAENSAAIAFSTLPEERKQEILSNPHKLTRRPVVRRYGLFSGTPPKVDEGIVHSSHHDARYDAEGTAGVLAERSAVLHSMNVLGLIPRRKKGQSPQQYAAFNSRIVEAMTNELRDHVQRNPFDPQVAHYVQLAHQITAPEDELDPAGRISLPAPEVSTLGLSAALAPMVQRVAKEANMRVGRHPKPGDPNVTRVRAEYVPEPVPPEPGTEEVVDLSDPATEADYDNTSHHAIDSTEPVLTPVFGTGNAPLHDPTGFTDATDFLPGTPRVTGLESSPVVKELDKFLAPPRKPRISAQSRREVYQTIKDHSELMGENHPSLLELVQNKHKLPKRSALALINGYNTAKAANKLSTGDAPQPTTKRVWPPTPRADRLSRREVVKYGSIRRRPPVEPPPPFHDVEFADNPPLPPFDDHDRRLWVLNHEPLYLRWRDEQPNTDENDPLEDGFIDRNREEIDTHIRQQPGMENYPQRMSRRTVKYGSVRRRPPEPPPPPEFDPPAYLSHVCPNCYRGGPPTFYPPESDGTIMAECPECGHFDESHHWNGNEEQPEQYAAGSYRAPPGGMVARGSFYVGGQMVPSVGGDFMSSGRRKRKRIPRRPKPSLPPSDDAHV